MVTKQRLSRRRCEPVALDGPSAAMGAERSQTLTKKAPRTETWGQLSKLPNHFLLRRVVAHRALRGCDLAHTDHQNSGERVAR
jgi:hypothetical protein